MQTVLRRSVLNFRHSRLFCSSTSNTRLERELCQLIRFSGPMPVAQYMREVLSNPVSGYYAAHNKSDAFVSDFITSPEVSQMFGECLGVWLVNEWFKMGAPRPLQLVEFGPGTGALMKDIIRTFEALLKTKDLSEILSLHLIEISPNLRKLQKVQLADDSNGNTIQTPSGIPIHWHRSLDTVPRGFSMFMAHEYLDALPIHQFVKNDENEWREILVDISPNNDEKLRFVMAREKTPALALVPKDDPRPALELCPDAQLLAKAMSNRIAEDGGAGLIIDYGHCGEKELTLRSFRKHAILEDALQFPGLADVTADVDFQQFRSHCCPERTITFGPVRQSEALEALGIKLRMEKLSSSSNEKVASIIEENYKTLTDHDKMGDKFKFFSIFPKTMEDILKKYPPAGFHH